MNKSKKKTDFQRAYENTNTNDKKCTKIELFRPHLHTSKKNDNNSFARYFELKLSFSSGNRTVSRTSKSGAKGPRFENKTDHLLGQNQGTCAGC